MHLACDGDGGAPALAGAGGGAGGSGGSGGAGGLGEGGADRVSEADEASALLGLVPRPAGGVASGALAAPTRWNDY